jgi:hypothetical protein
MYKGTSSVARTAAMTRWGFSGPGPDARIGAVGPHPVAARDAAAAERAAIRLGKETCVLELPSIPIGGSGRRAGLWRVLPGLRATRVSLKDPVRA